MIFSLGYDCGMIQYLTKQLFPTIVNFHALWQLEGELYLPQDIVFKVANQHAGKKALFN